MSIDDFNAQIKALIQTAVKESIQQQSNTQFELVTSDELAEVLKVSKMSIHNWRNEGWLLFYKLGNNVRFSLKEVMEAIRKRNNQKGKRTNKKNAA
jgi:excisionase family DNA binding protein